MFSFEFPVGKIAIAIEVYLALIATDKIYFLFNVGIRLKISSIAFFFLSIENTVLKWCLHSASSLLIGIQMKSCYYLCNEINTAEGLSLKFNKNMHSKQIHEFISDRIRENSSIQN